MLDCFTDVNKASTRIANNRFDAFRSSFGLWNVSARPHQRRVKLLRNLWAIRCLFTQKESLKRNIEVNQRTSQSQRSIESKTRFDSDSDPFLFPTFMNLFIGSFTSLQKTGLVKSFLSGFYQGTYN